MGVGIYTFATLVVVHWVVYKVTQNNLWAFFTAVIYAYSTYRIVDIWTRFALGEFIALTFIPLIIYGLYAIIVGNYNEANCRMRLASHWQNKKRHCDVSCIILSDQTKMRRYVQ